MRSRGRRGGRGRGGRGEGGRRGARPGGAASRDDRDMRDRRPDYSPRRHNDYSPRGRSRSPGRRAGRPRGEYDDRDVTRGSRGPTGGGRVCDRDRPYGGNRSPPPGRGDSSYDQPGRGRRENYGGPVSYGGDRDRPIGRGDLGYDDLHGGDRDLPHQGRRDDYSSDRDLPHHGHSEDYYLQERDRGGLVASETCNARPAYMLHDHPSNLSQPFLYSGRKESDYFGGPNDRSLKRDSEYVGSPGGRYIGRERELLGVDGMALRISATESGRTTALYQERRSPPLRAALSPPPPLYPSAPPTDKFLTGGSDMVTGDDFGTGSTRLLHDHSRFKYENHLRDSDIERSRGTERNYSGSRDVHKEDGGTDRLYPSVDVPILGDIEADRLYSSRGMLESDLMPCTQLKQIGDSSSSLFAKDRQYRMHGEPDIEKSNGYVMNDLGILPHGSSGCGRVHAHRFTGRSFEHGSDHGDEALLDITRQEHSLAPRAEPMEYGGHEYVTRDPIIDTYIASEDLRGNVSQNPRHMSSSALMARLKDERINHHMKLPHRMGEDEDSYQSMPHDTEDNLLPSYGAHAPVRYPPARGGRDRYSHSPGFDPIGTARRPARQHEFASFEDGCDLSDRDVSPMISRKRYRSPASRDYVVDMHKSDDRFAGGGYYDTVEYDTSPRRMTRIYDMADEDDEDARYDTPCNWNVFSRLGLPDEISGEWTDAEQEGYPQSSTLAYGHSKHIPISQRLSRPIGHSKFGAPSMLGRGRGLTKRGKKRMRIARHHFAGGYTSPRNEFIMPKKYPKSSEDDNPNDAEMGHEDTPECEDFPAQKDPPEGSEEFTKQVHKAFLKYAKILNETPAMQKKFRDAAKGTLSCCVCGSATRKFPDIDALVSHAYYTCKVGLKTKHLGFHKALCVLIGWNWHIAPDTSKSHYSIPAEEVNAMKGDLMLWPPVVVIHNSSIAIKTKDTESKIVSKEELEVLLADIGIPHEKAKVGQGKSANQSVLLVQFQPTISGFQEAMRIHEHFSAKNHGKEDFQQMRSGKGKQTAPIDNLDELLYGHIAVAEDLGYLDEATKRRCLIRSKMDIEAKADATLNMEP